MDDFVVDFDGPAPSEAPQQEVATTATTTPTPKTTPTKTRTKRKAKSAGSAKTKAASPKKPRKRRKPSAPTATASVCVDAGASQGAPASLDLTSAATAAAAAAAEKKTSAAAKTRAKAATTRKRGRAASAKKKAETTKRPRKRAATSAAKSKSSKEKAKVLDQDPLKAPRMSETVAAMRDTARQNMPDDARERIFTSDSISYLSADPTREEEKATLASMAAGPGKPLEKSAPPPTQKPATDAAAQPPPAKKAKRTRKSTRPPSKRATRTRTRKGKEPVVHQLADLPPKEQWGAPTPSEAQAEAGQLPETREIGKHPGKVKTAGMGVAVPPPGARESHLRRQLDASALSRSAGAVVIKPEKGTPQASAATGTVDLSQPAAAGEKDRWETESAAQVASALDDRRMDVATASVGGGEGPASRPVLPLAELRTAFSDQNRLTLSDARTTLARYLTGMIEQQCLEIDAAARLVSAKNSMRYAAPGSSAPSASGTNGGGGTRRTRRGAGPVLMLDASEEEILERVCGAPVDAVISAAGGDQGDGGQPARRPEDEVSLRCALPRVGLGRAIDMPLDEIEVAVLTGSSLRDAMVYFMSFDDSVKAMEQAYDSVVKMASLPNKMDALREQTTPAMMRRRDRNQMVGRLSEYEKQLDAQWQLEVSRANSGSGPEEGPSTDPVSETWVRRNSVRVLRAILTGELDGHRHNIVRTLVAREEKLMGLYREPAMRCFLGDERQAGGSSVEGPKAGCADTDVLNMMRRMLGEDGLTKHARLVLPDLGTPATKAYCADFLRAPDPDRPLERPCVHGERGCIAWIMAAHAAWPATGGLNRASHAFVMREFYSPDRWQRIQQERSLPDERVECLLCGRMTATYYWVQLRLLDSRGVVGLRDELRDETWRGTLLGQTHCNAIEPEAGYAEGDMLPVCNPTDGPWTGIVQPIVAFRANAYVPGECTSPIDLSKPQPLGPTVVRAVLAQGETGSATGSCRADDLLFGPDMTATGTSIGRSYLGTPRMHPIAGTDRSLGKLLRRELADLYGDGKTSWWNPAVHPWVFCCFDKTLTTLSAFTDPTQPPPPAPRLRYRWRGIIPPSPPDPQFHLALTSDEAQAVQSTARAVRWGHHRDFVEHRLGFFGARRTDTDTAVVLDAICLRAHEAHEAQQRVARDRAIAESGVRSCRRHCDRAGAMRHEARVRRLEELDLTLQLWSDQMLDLAYWMQRNAAVRKRGYTDGPDLDRAATHLLYPHGRRFVSIYDTPDLVPWLLYTSACQERNYWSPPGGAGGLSIPATNGAGDAAGPASSSSSAAASQGMAALAHMVLSKSNPHPCKIRNLDQIAVRNALEDPPVGLAAMDMVHILLMGNYPGCRNRPPFAVRARVRVQSIAFRGATASETTQWMKSHYRLLHLSFKEWYAQTVRWSPAYEAVVADIQHHAEYVRYGRRAADELRQMLASYGATSRSAAQQAADAGRDFVRMPHPDALDDAAHMSHGLSLCTFGKLRKGSFATTLCDRMRGWLRALCTGKEDMAHQYKEELTQMMVLSKIVYSQPEYGTRVVEDIQAARSAEATTKDPAEASWRVPPAGASDRDRIDRWSLGAPLASLPTSLIESFLKWEGDSALSVSPWFADRSFFLSEPYPFLDRDTLQAIDLAAWMCARRTDGRFVMSWLRYPIGLSAQAYQRLQTLYFSYECCDVADNSFLVQLRRFLFRRRRREIPAAEYEARVAAKDASIVHRHTEKIQSVQDGCPPRTVAYRIMEEYGTRQSRRDFAILYEYVNRVVAYGTWSSLPLPRRVARHQLEAVKRRQTVEPWCLTDHDLLGSRHLCPCGRWCCQVVLPPLRSVTSSITERRRSLASGSDLAQLSASIEDEAQRRIDELWAAATKEMEAMQRPEASQFATEVGHQQAVAQYAGEQQVITERFEQGQLALLQASAVAISRVEARQPVMHNVVPTRRAGRPGSGGGGSRTAGAVNTLDEMDLRMTVRSARWSDPDWMVRPDPLGPEDDTAKPAKSASGPKRPGGGGGGGGRSRSLYVGGTHTVMPSSAEPVTRDVHPSDASHVIGGAYVTCDLATQETEGGGGRLVSKEPNLAPYCRGQLFRINLLGHAVRPKGPKAAPDGPWYTLCATCGCLTTVDMGRWDHRGPTCGAHGRPHRLPDRIADYDPKIEGAVVARRGADRASVLRLPEPPPQPSSPLPSIELAKRVRVDLSMLDAVAGLPCPEETPCCWYCHMPADQRPAHPARGPNNSNNSPEGSTENGDADGADDQQQQQQQRPLAVRYRVGTSVATASVGCAGAALYARAVTTGGTNQAAPVRRINARGSMFGQMGGRRLKPQHRSSGKFQAHVLPADMLPGVGEEMTLKVLDNVGEHASMRLRWIYLCPKHMKDVRVGWIALRGRVVQIDVQQKAAEKLADLGGGAKASSLQDTELMMAASGRRIGTRAMVRHMYASVPLLSTVLRAIKRGRDHRTRQTTRFGGGGGSATGLRAIPDYGDRRKRRGN